MLMVETIDYLGEQSATGFFRTSRREHIASGTIDYVLIIDAYWLGEADPTELFS